MNTPTPGMPDTDELALIAAGFPDFSIWRSVTAAGSRYVAQGRNLHARPYTVVTDDLAAWRRSARVTPVPPMSRNAPYQVAMESL
jgi:hypothetical protein